MNLNLTAEQARFIRELIRDDGPPRIAGMSLDLAAHCMDGLAKLDEVLKWSEPKVEIVEPSDV